jgi:electron transfer flavoprotein alpha/beta subunit
MIAEIASDSGRYLLLLGGYALDGYARVIGLKLAEGGKP